MNLKLKGINRSSKTSQVTSNPDVSYWRLLFGSDKILYENVTSLNMSDATGSFRFLSGWYLRTNEEKGKKIRVLSHHNFIREQKGKTSSITQLNKQKNNIRNVKSAITE